MELANQPPPQEIALCQTSSLCPNSAAIGAVSLPAPAVVGRVALVLPGLELSTSRSRESWLGTGPQSLVFSCLFRLSPARGRELCPMTGREELRPFRFRPTLSPFHLRLSLFPPPLSLFQLTRPRVRPAPFSVEQVVVQRWNLVFGRSKSSRKR